MRWLLLLLSLPAFAQFTPPSGGGSGCGNPNCAVAGNLTVAGTATIGAAVPTGAPAGTLAANCLTSGANGVYNAKCYGLKGDERTVTDAVCASGSPTCTSATAVFTSADTGKVVTVNAGSRTPLNFAYSSGGSITGGTGQVCTVSGFNGSGSGATGVIALTSANTITASTAGILTAIGTGYSGAVTSATLGNGTAIGLVNLIGTAVTWVAGPQFVSSSQAGQTIAINGVDYTVSTVNSASSITLTTNPGLTLVNARYSMVSARCSGTATLSVTNYWYYPLTTTGTVVNATTITLGTNATSNVSGAILRIGTDDSTAFSTLITDVYNAGGGSIFFPQGTYLLNNGSQYTFPTDGDHSIGPFGHQPPLVISGAGSLWDGSWGGRSYPHGNPTVAATTLDLRASSGYKWKSQGAGSITLRDVHFADYGYDTAPFLLITGTVLFTDRVSWAGSAPVDPVSNVGVLSVNDAMTFGLPGGGEPFQGYGTLVRTNYFYTAIARGVYLTDSTNQVIVADNTWGNESGSTTVSAVEIDGTTGGAIRNRLYGNRFNSNSYAYAVTLKNALGTELLSNRWEDQNALITIASLTLIGTSTTTSCLMCGLLGSPGSPYIDQGSNAFRYYDGLAWRGAAFAVNAPMVVTGPDNAYGTSPFTINNLAGNPLIATTDDGRVYVGANNGQNALLNINYGGAKSSGDPLSITDATHTLKFFTTVISTDSANFALGSNVAGSALSFTAPTANNIIDINGAQAKIKAMQVINTTTDPGCTASGDNGKIWIDSTSAATTHMKVCGQVASLTAWVTVF